MYERAVLTRYLHAKASLKAIKILDEKDPQDTVDLTLNLRRSHLKLFGLNFLVYFISRMLIGSKLCQ